MFSGTIKYKSGSQTSWQTWSEWGGPHYSECQAFECHPDQEWWDCALVVSQIDEDYRGNTWVFVQIEVPWINHHLTNMRSNCHYSKEDKTPWGGSSTSWRKLVLLVGGWFLSSVIQCLIKWNACLVSPSMYTCLGCGFTQSMQTWLFFWK